MSSLEMHPTVNATSAAGAMLMRQARGPVLLGVMLAGIGTSTAYTLPADTVLHSRRVAVQTTAGTSVSAATPSGSAIGELRRVSGLTWDQLARLFNVSRRSLHFWASGKSMAPSNEEHLQRLLTVVRKVDRGSASANRAILLGVREDGNMPFDLLAEGGYERVLSLLGPGEGRRVSPLKLSEDARTARAPQSPEELVGALHDRIHRDGGTTRAAKSVRVRGGG
ncbi:XRE family transcriptional regulator [Candidatus Accumulibacter phosphatis]|uniref:XRE family transcriptional regulator n=1 Tax=Candidatus Accumulibacter phosphatis TaxID=327160 RepID=A0ABX1U0Y7_9PROT|nr:XRE family transcriptional regulator [Candidatus Accumulibacter phosphatis]NMQ29138.1 XRE family transcriptional regulator [Candidatus Accumulibacter phosphatis]